MNNLQNYRTLSSDFQQDGVIQLKFMKKREKNKSLSNILLSLTKNAQIIIWNFADKSVSSPISIIDTKIQQICSSLQILDEDKIAILNDKGKIPVFSIYGEKQIG